MKRATKFSYLTSINCIQFHFRPHARATENGNRTASQKAGTSARDSGERSEITINTESALTKAIHVGKEVDQ